MLAIVLAKAFLAGELNVNAVAERAAQVLGKPWPWLGPLARRFDAAFANRPRPRHREVVVFLRADRTFRRIATRRLKVRQWLTGPQPMLPVPAARAWKIPAIDSAGSLAAWLGVTPSELDWFADLADRARRHRNSRLEHYRYRVLTKRSGGIRLIEAPKERLKTLQRQILEQILDRIPPHPSAHGFVHGRSIRTFAAPHVKQRVILRMDLSEFFPSISRARIQAMFRTAGYPESVAGLLGGICTNTAPRDIATGEAWQWYGRPHLPQGAPTSPALANICAWRMDRRLSSLAEACGAVYTRYADDLAFSGDENFERCVERFAAQAAAILQEEGFRVNHDKTRIMRQSVRQHLAGLVANQRVNVRRAEFDLLKAILTNCVRLGPESQNREGHPHFREHLEGRVAFVESINPAKGRRLRAILERIRW
jgi:RNA-directed DNA polymerase